MLHEVDLHLAERIAAIEARGTGHLRAVGRRAALRKAWGAALSAAVAVPALAFAVGWFVPLRWEAVAGAALLVPAAAFAGIFVRDLRRQHVTRRAATALFDHALALKDRIATTDEFLRDPAPSPFKRAAMGEADPWIARAATAPLPALDAQQGTWRRWPFAAAALALLAGTVAQQQLRPAPANPSPFRDALVRAGIARPGLPARRDRGGDGTAASGPAGAPASDSPDPSRTAATPGGTGGAERQSDGAGRAGAAQGATLAAQGFDTPGASRAGGAATAQPGDARSAQAGAHGDSGKGGDRTPSAQDGRSAAGDKAGADRAAPDGESNRQGGNMQQPGNTAAQPPSASPLAPQQRPQTGKGSNGSQQGQQNRNQQNKSDQTQPGQGKGQGRDGQRNGEDALKRSNGVAALLLAVPMADRLGGTANPGLVSSQPQQVPPHAGASGGAVAGDRGTGSGDAGRLPHRPATPQDRRLVRDYFRPSGVRP